MKLEPLNDHLLIKRIVDDEIDGGIIIPETARTKSRQGFVVAVGNGKLLDDGSFRFLDVEEGDRVIFGKYSGTELTIGGEEHVILREDDVLCVLTVDEAESVQTPIR